MCREPTERLLAAPAPTRRWPRNGPRRLAPPSQRRTSLARRRAASQLRQRDPSSCRSLCGGYRLPLCPLSLLLLLLLSFAVVPEFAERQTAAPLRRWLRRFA